MDNNFKKISTFGFGFGIQPKAEYFSVFGLRLQPNVKLQLRSFTVTNIMIYIKPICSYEL